VADAGKLTPHRAARAAAAAYSDERLVGQVLLPSFRLGTPPGQAADVVARWHLGGAIVLGDGSAAQVRRLVDEIRAACVADGQRFVPITAIDQEYGWVTRIHSGIVQLPSAMAFGAAGRPDLTTTAWRAAGVELAAAGITVNFAPVADVVRSASNGAIGTRSFGADPALVADQVRAVVAGLAGAGVEPTLKHFPGHGSTDVDSHESLPVLRGALSDDLLPFRAGIAAGARLVMMGHLDARSIDPGVPASFSRRAIVEVLRGDLGFDGVVVCDSLSMQPARVWSPAHAAVRALLAGNDLLLMPPDLPAAYRGLLAALDTGELPRERLVEAVIRILTLKWSLGHKGGLQREDGGLRDDEDGPSDERAHEEGGDSARAVALLVARAAVTVFPGGGRPGQSGPEAGSPGVPLSVASPVRVTASPGRERQVAWLCQALAEHGIALVAADGGPDEPQTVVHLVGHGDTFADLAADATVTVSMDLPFLLAEASSPVRVATYSSTPASMRALASVLAGAATAPGRLPVAVPG
jgi:beta-N-acetylhexosaminidase